MGERTVWKYVLDRASNPVRMPTEAQILTVAAQGHDLCMWALVTPSNATETRALEVYGTGQPIPNGLDLEYLGSAHFSDPTPLVFHIFEHVPGTAKGTK